MTNKTQTLGNTDSDVALATDTKMPQLFALIMHNDDYTTQEFVVEVLMTVFGASFANGCGAHVAGAF